MEEYKIVIGLGAIAAYLIKYLQGSKYFPWITAEAKKITLVVQGVLALLASLGIGYSWDPAAHSLMITGLSLTVVFHGLMTWISQFAIQHGFTNLITLGQLNGVPGLPAAPDPAPAPVPAPRAPPQGGG